MNYLSLVFDTTMLWNYMTLELSMATSWYLVERELFLYLLILADAA